MKTASRNFSAACSRRVRGNDCVRGGTRLEASSCRCCMIIFREQTPSDRFARSYGATIHDSVRTGLRAGGRCRSLAGASPRTHVGYGAAAGPLFLPVLPTGEVHLVIGVRRNVCAAEAATSAAVRTWHTRRCPEWDRQYESTRMRLTSPKWWVATVVLWRGNVPATKLCHRNLFALCRTPIIVLARLSTPLAVNSYLRMST